MPLLLCPNDDASMQTVKRAGVEFDMCPSCRGVWLDRGELENLMAAASADAAAGAPPAQQRTGHRSSQRDDDDRRRQHEDDDHGGRAPHKKRRGMDIFDIFD